MLPKMFGEYVGEGDVKLWIQVLYQTRTVVHGSIKKNPQEKERKLQETEGRPR